MTIRVDIEDLVTSGTAVAGFGEEVAMAHTASDGRIDAARPGWQGRSAEALATKSGLWAHHSRSLVAQLSEHAQGLLASAGAFWNTEQRGANQLGGLR